MGTVTKGWVSIREYVPGPGKSTINVECYLGPTPPKVIGGYARWENITRPKRKAVTEWQGIDPMRVELDILIDYHEATYHGTNPGVKCEQDMRNLELLAGATEKDKGPKHPPLIHWDANMMHDDHHAGHVSWVIESLEWGEIMFNDTPNIVRAAAKVVLMEWVEDEFITQSGAKKNRSRKNAKGKNKKGRSGKSSTYRVTIQDTQRQGLKTIAIKKFGDVTRWRDIAKLNKIRDPHNIRPDQIIKLPKK